jgi:hypothetical protein
VELDTEIDRLYGVPLDEFVDAVFPRLAHGDPEIGYGFGEETRRASRSELDGIFAAMNQVR